MTILSITKKTKSFVQFVVALRSVTLQRTHDTEANKLKQVLAPFGNIDIYLRMNVLV